MQDDYDQLSLPVRDVLHFVSTQLETLRKNTHQKEPQLLISNFSIRVSDLILYKNLPYDVFIENIRNTSEDKISDEKLKKIEFKGKEIRINLIKYIAAVGEYSNVCYSFSRNEGFCNGKLLHIVANILDPLGDYEDNFFQGLELIRDATYAIDFY